MIPHGYIRVRSEIQSLARLQCYYFCLWRSVLGNQLASQLVAPSSQSFHVHGTVVLEYLWYKMLWISGRFILIYEDVKLHKEKSLQIVFIFLISWNLLLNIWDCTISSNFLKRLYSTQLMCVCVCAKKLSHDLFSHNRRYICKVIVFLSPPFFPLYLALQSRKWDFFLKIKYGYKML